MHIYIYIIRRPFSNKERVLWDIILMINELGFFSDFFP